MLSRVDAGEVIADMAVDVCRERDRRCGISEATGPTGACPRATPAAAAFTGLSRGENTVTIHVFQETHVHSSVLSHFAQHWRGRAPCGRAPARARRARR